MHFNSSTSAAGPKFKTAIECARFCVENDLPVRIITKGWLGPEGAEVVVKSISKEIPNRKMCVVSLETGIVAGFMPNASL